jgi:integrase
MERCGRCGVEAGEIPEIRWWCWWCQRALCESCGGSDTATFGVVPRTCDRKRAELREIRWHDLRHSFASHLVAAGVPLNVVQARMGHSTILMTMRYSHLEPEQHRLFVDLIGPAEVQPRRKSRDSEAAPTKKPARIN